jgi:uncharacterized RDD family membrane protein YckC
VTSGTSAGFGRRLAAGIYDALLLVGVLMVYTAALLFLTHGNAVLGETVGESWAGAYRLSLLVVIGGYFVGNWLHSGQTLGMRAWRLHAVDAGGRRLRAWPAVLRFVLAVCAWLPAALGVLWLYVDPERLALQDRLSGTRIVHVAGA